MQILAQVEFKAGIAALMTAHFIAVDVQIDGVEDIVKIDLDFVLKRFGTDFECLSISADASVKLLFHEIGNAEIVRQADVIPVRVVKIALVRLRFISADKLLAAVEVFLFAYAGLGRGINGFFCLQQGRRRHKAQKRKDRKEIHPYLLNTFHTFLSFFSRLIAKIARILSDRSVCFQYRRPESDSRRFGRFNNTQIADKTEKGKRPLYFGHWRDHPKSGTL